MNYRKMYVSSVLISGLLSVMASQIKMHQSTVKQQQQSIEFNRATENFRESIDEDFDRALRDIRNFRESIPDTPSLNPDTPSSPVSPSPLPKHWAFQGQNIDTLKIDRTQLRHVTQGDCDAGANGQIICLKGGN